MRIRTLILLALVGALATGPSMAQADDDPVYAALLADKAASVVTVKMVLNVKMNMGGTTNEREVNLNASGVIVDASGLVMVPSAALNPFGGRRRGGRARGGGPQATPVSIRVLFPGDTKEYTAILGAKDSKLGLAFLLIRDLEAKKPVSTPLEKAGSISLGQTLYGVSRLGQGFDDAAVVLESKVAGKVMKPREMWAMEGSGLQPGRPLFDASGATVGIMISQEGVGDEGSARRAFLLPLDVAKRTIETSAKQSKEELDRILEEEEEAAARAADAPKKDDGNKADDKKADDKKADGGEAEDK